MNKIELRQLMRNLIAGLSTDEMTLHDTQITSLFLKTQKFMPQSSVACYMPLKGEVSCKPIIQTLFSGGYTTSLPVVTGREDSLIFRNYRPGDKLVRGIMGPLEPVQTAREIIPDVILVPMLGFTRSKHRLGYGTGFYDRTFEAFRHTKPIRTIGLAYSMQETSDLDIEPHDIPLDIIITEKEVIV